MKAYAAEVLGTFWLVLGGCGCAILAANGATNGIGPLGVSLAFGLSVMTAALTLGAFSGGHFNPAVTFASALVGRLPWNKVPGYVVAQIGGATFAALALYLIASGRSDFTLAKGFAANGFGAHSPGEYGLLSALLIEIIGTALFVFVILTVTATKDAAKAAPYVIGAMLTLVHLVLIPITNASVNPARSTSQALIVGDWALGQLWIFWVAPLIGAALAALVLNVFAPKNSSK